jgi:hypothetical protein
LLFREEITRMLFAFPKPFITFLGKADQVVWGKLIAAFFG